MIQLDWAPSLAGVSPGKYTNKVLVYIKLLVNFSETDYICIINADKGITISENNSV